MKVLIIGGMGVIGGSISKAAAKKGYDVFVLSRRALTVDFEKLGVNGIQGDWSNDEFAKNVVSNTFFDVIIDTQIFNKKQLIRSLSICNNFCKHFFYISTDSVYIHPGYSVKESDEIELKALKWWYGYRKRECELYLYENSEKYSFQWTIIRPTVTFGKTRIPVGYSCKRNTFALPNRLLKNKPIVVFDEKDSLHAICHVSIFGEAVTSLFLNKLAYREAFHISDNKAYTYLEIYNAIEDVLNVKGNYIHLDSSKLYRYDKELFNEMVYDKNPTFTLDNSKIKKACPDINFHVDIKEIMTDIIAFLRESSNEDKEFDLITDCLLRDQVNSIKSESEKYIVKEYLSSLTAEENKALNEFKKQKKIKLMKTRLYKSLLPIRFLLRPLRNIYKTLRG